jgi:serine/threonine-protein kinase
MIGTIINQKYQVVGKAGSGVYEGLDLQTRQRVVLKLLVAAHPAFVHQLHIEMQALNQTSNDWLTPILNWGQQDDVFFIAHEWVEGKTLRFRMEKQPRTKPDPACDIAVQILLALGELHQVGAAHRNLKPENLIVGGPSGLKMLDYSFYDKPNNFFSAPEQVKGFPGDQRADIYAAGAILFTLIYARPPIAGNPLPSLPRIPVGLGAILVKALAVNPEERYQNASEMLKALRLYLGIDPEAIPIYDGPPIPGLHTPFAPPTPLSHRPPRWLLIVLILLAILLILAIGLVISFIINQTSQTVTSFTILLDPAWRN